MEDTDNLALPYLMPAQAQKHVTHNEALRMLDAIVQLGVVDRDRATPPVDPADGARYLVADGASGAWEGHEGWVAAWQDNAWQLYEPAAGWLCHVVDENLTIVFDGTQWTAIAGASSDFQNITRFGLGTQADEDNPFSAKLGKALWTARFDDEGGDGNLRYTMNKQASGNTLSLLMQSNWSGRAEIGLVGDDDLSVKVSDDGSTWNESLRIGRGDGRVSFPQGIVDPVTGLIPPLYIPAPVGEIYRCDASRAGTPRTVQIAGASGDTIALASAVAGQNGEWGRWDKMNGNAYVRIWNTSKSPAQSAWIRDSPADDALQVTDAADIAGWQNGDVLQLGDPNPTGDNTLGFIAIDISPYLQANFGTVFAQKGVFLAIFTMSSDGTVRALASGNGGTGTAIGCHALADGSPNQAHLPLPTSTPSPISDSNLLFMGELLFEGSDVLVTYLRVLGVYV